MIIIICRSHDHLQRRSPFVALATIHLLAGEYPSLTWGTAPPLINRRAGGFFDA